MHERIGFDEAVDRIIAKDGRFHRDAFFFLRETLDLTVERLGRNGAAGGGQGHHVTGPELLAGFRDHALELYGPMAATVLEEWGIRRCGDVGDMVYGLIETGIFGRSETDRREDFDGVFDFTDAFIRPFRYEPGANVARNS